LNTPLSPDDDSGEEPAGEGEPNAAQAAQPSTTKAFGCSTHVRNFRCWSRWCSRVAWAARLVRWVASS